MKNKIILILCSLLTIFNLTACTSTYKEAVAKQEEEEVELKTLGGEYFTILTEWTDINYNYKIVYANDTKVKYFILYSGHRLGITALYNPDGTLQVYEED